MKVEVPTVLLSQSNDVNATSSSIVMSVADSKLDEQTKPHFVTGTTSISSSLVEGPVNNTQSEVSLPSEHFHKARSTHTTTISDNSMKTVPSQQIGASGESAEVVSGQQLTMYPDDDAEVVSGQQITMYPDDDGEEVSGHPTLITDKSTQSLTDHPTSTLVSLSKRSSSKRSSKRSSKHHSNKKKKRPSQSYSQRVSVVENSKKSRRRLRKFILFHFIIL